MEIENKTLAKMEQAYTNLFSKDWFYESIFANKDFAYEIQTYKGISVHYNAILACMQQIGCDYLYASTNKNRSNHFSQINSDSFQNAIIAPNDLIVRIPNSWSDYMNISCVQNAIYSPLGNFGIIYTLDNVIIFTGTKEILDNYYRLNPDYLQNRIHALNYLNLEDEIPAERFMLFLDKYFPQHKENLNPEYYAALELDDLP